MSARLQVVSKLAYRAPLAWRELISFLAPRAVPGVESVLDGCYRRLVELGGRIRRLEVRPAALENNLAVTVDPAAADSLPSVELRTRRLFDLDADPLAITSVLASDPVLAPLAAERPGLRVPGAWNGFELAVRAILGQQVTVRGATTLCGRLVEEYGKAVPGGLLFPKPATLARARFTRVGLPRTRAAALRGLAGACAGGELRLEPGADPAEARAALTRIPGIGDWTAEYVAMRALADRDAFPAGDLGLLRAAAKLVPSEDGHPPTLRPAALRRLAERWRPWRSYAAMHLWRSLT